MDFIFRVFFLLCLSSSLFSSPFFYVSDDVNAFVVKFDAATNTQVGSPIMFNGPASMVVTPDGKYLYVADTTDMAVYVVDTETDMTLPGFVSLTTIPQGMAITPNGTRLYTANADGTISVIDTMTNMVVNTITGGTTFKAIGITPDGSRAYVTDTSSNEVFVIDLATNAVIGSPISVGAGPTNLAITPDGKQVYVTSLSSNSASVINTTTNIASPINVGEHSSFVTVSLDGNQVYLFGVGDPMNAFIHVFDTVTNMLLTTITTPQAPGPLTTSPYGTSIYMCTGFNPYIFLSVINSSTNMIVPPPFPMMGFFGEVVSIVFIPPQVIPPPIPTPSSCSKNCSLFQKTRL